MKTFYFQKYSQLGSLTPEIPQFEMYSFGLIQR